ncbi:ATP-grasp domain-containing protein [Candidatus Nomurabacteria bacterium]|nr:ATP-grasp domain-containing protein [Candidatus Nomurabacteria bacterium]
MESRSVQKVFDQDELQRACLHIFLKNKTYVEVDHGEIVLEEAYQQNSYALIEKCLTGEKVSAEVIVSGGQCHVLHFTRKYDYDNKFFYERADIVETHLSPEHERSLKIAAKKIISANQIVTAILHIEFFFESEKNEFKLIEINYRLGGGDIPELIFRAFGLDMVSKFLDLLNNPNQPNVATEPTEKRIWIAFYFLVDHGGILKIRSNKAFSAPIKWSFSDGEIISKFQTSHFYNIGTVIFDAIDTHDLEKKCATLMNDTLNFFEIDGIVESSTEKLQTNFFDPTITKNKAKRLLTNVLPALTIVISAVTGSYFYKNYSEQAHFWGETLAKTLSYHLVNGEASAF